MTWSDVTVGFFGCGHMGSALIERLSERVSAERIFVFDKDQHKQKLQSDRLGVQGCAGAADLLFRSSVVIVAVKPQDVGPLLASMKGADGKLVISIAAGVALSFMEVLLGSQVSLVRAMPNLNALIGAGITALSFNARVSHEERLAAEEIFKSVGDVITVAESQMDAVTAISGSGPAFVAFLLETVGPQALETTFARVAESLGIERDKAQRLALATVSGTRQMLSVNFDADMLIKRVSSKGGTTEAGMGVLRQKGKTEAVLSEAIHAAFRRARELSQANT